MYSVYNVTILFLHYNTGVFFSFFFFLFFQNWDKLQVFEAEFGQGKGKGVTTLEPL